MAEALSKLYGLDALLVEMLATALLSFAYVVAGRHFAGLADRRALSPVVSVPYESILMCSLSWMMA